MLPIHPIKYRRGMQNLRRRAYRCGTSFNCLTIFEIGHRTNAYWKTVYVNARGIRYVVAFLLKLLKSGLPTSACLIELVADKLINFQAVVKGKGFVKSIYSSAAEFRTTITDRLCEQQGAQVLRRFSEQNEQHVVLHYFCREKRGVEFQMSHREQTLVC